MPTTVVCDFSVTTAPSAAADGPVVNRLGLRAKLLLGALLLAAVPLLIAAFLVAGAVSSQVAPAGEPGPAALARPTIPIRRPALPQAAVRA